MNDFIITNIQRFSLHDGPGIRTTIFFKGCNLRCPWCANPENIEFQIQNYINDGVSGVYGKRYSEDELFEFVIRDKSFYKGSLKLGQWNITDAEEISMLPGGVTFSGGEPLLIIDKLDTLIKQLSAERIHTCIETSLYAPIKNVDIAINLIDFIYVDLKLLDKDKFQSVLKGNYSVFSQNLGYFSRNCEKPVVIRVPIIGGYTDCDDNIEDIISALKSMKDTGLNIIKVELLKEHHLGLSKYKSIGYPVPNYSGVKNEKMYRIRDKMNALSIPVDTCIL